MKRQNIIIYDDNSQPRKDCIWVKNNTAFAWRNGAWETVNIGNATDPELTPEPEPEPQ